jgi:hypothetical protein
MPIKRHVSQERPTNQIAFMAEKMGCIVSLDAKASKGRGQYMST